MRGRKRGFDPLDLILENAGLNVGIMGSAGVVGSLPDNPQKTSILKGMDTLTLLPRVHAAGGVFRSLGELKKIR